MTKAELPDKFTVKTDESKVSKKILPILSKGLHYKRHPYCVAFSMMQE